MAIVHHKHVKASTHNVHKKHITTSDDFPQPSTAQRTERIGFLNLRWFDLVLFSYAYQALNVEDADDNPDPVHVSRLYEIG